MKGKLRQGCEVSKLVGGGDGTWNRDKNILGNRNSAKTSGPNLIVTNSKTC